MLLQLFTLIPQLAEKNWMKQSRSTAIASPQKRSTDFNLWGTVPKDRNRPVSCASIDCLLDIRAVAQLFAKRAAGLSSRKLRTAAFSFISKDFRRHALGIHAPCSRELTGLEGGDFCRKRYVL